MELRGPSQDSVSSVSRCASPTSRPLEGVRDWLPVHHPSEHTRDYNVGKRAAEDVRGTEGTCLQDVTVTMEENPLAEVCIAV